MESVEGKERWRGKYGNEKFGTVGQKKCVRGKKGHVVMRMRVRHVAAELHDGASFYLVIKKTILDKSTTSVCIVFL